MRWLLGFRVFGFPSVECIFDSFWKEIQGSPVVLAGNVLSRDSTDYEGNYVLGHVLCTWHGGLRSAWAMTGWSRGHREAIADPREVWEKTRKYMEQKKYCRKRNLRQPIIVRYYVGMIIALP